jgi:dihydrofolate reductase
MGVSVDGFIADRDGGIDWTVPGQDLFAFHVERARELGAVLCGRRLYETMLVWETEPALREEGELEAEFADIWTSLPKVVFSRTLERVAGNARLATASLAEEVATAVAATDKDVEVGGADLAGQALGLGLVDELSVFRYPIIVGGGTPHLPSLAARVAVELVEIRGFDGGIVHERYRRTTSS